MNRVQLLHGLDLDDHAFLDDEIETIGFPNDEVLVADGDRQLSTDVKAALHELPGQTLFVSRLEQSRPEVPVDLDRGADDRRGERVAKASGHSPSCEAGVT